MLQTLHSKASSLFMKILLFALVASFALWGIGDIFRASPGDAIVTVGNDAVTAQAFQNEYEQERSRFQQMLGKSYSDDMMLSLNIPRQVMDRMVERALLREEARNQGFVVSEAMISNELRANPMFAGENGQFDAEHFRNVLRNNRLTERQYYSMLSEEISTITLREAIGNNMLWPEMVTGLEFRRKSEKRVADVLYFPASLIKNVGEPSDEEITQLYADQAPSFQTQEFRTLSMVIIDPAEMAKNYQVPDEELLIEYQSRMDAYHVPEERHVKQLLFADKAQAEAALKTLQSGADFDTVGVEHNAINDEVDLGLVTRDAVMSDAEKAVFDMENPGVTQPVESAFGWHIFKVVSIHESRTKPLEEVKEELRDDLAFQWSQKESYDVSNQLADELAMGTTLEEAAKLLNLKPVKIGPINMRGEMEEGKTVNGISDELKLAVLPQAYQMQTGELSTLQETDEGVYYVVRLDNVQAPTVRPLDEVRSDVVAQWKNQKKHEQLNTLVQGVAEELASQDMAQVANATGARLYSGIKLTRTATTLDEDEGAKPVPASVVNGLFTISNIGDFTQPAATQDGGYMLAKLVAIETPKADAQTEALAELGNEISATIASEIFSDYVYQLRQKYDVDDVSDEYLHKLVTTE